MWCKNLDMCIDRNAYLASFPYGQCMDWTTHPDECPSTSKNTTDICGDYDTCDSCRSNPACGWCDDGSLTGLGGCRIGGASGPMHRRSWSHGHAEWVLNATSCPTSIGESWHFTTCPACQCNGHSNCTDSEDFSTCAQPCQHNTEGEQCEKCSTGFFGNAVNGGNCQRKF